MSFVTEQYSAATRWCCRSSAGVRLAPTNRAWLKAADIPLSLKLPEGFILVLRNSLPRRDRHTGLAASAGCSSVWPADRHAGLNRHERQQLVKTPHPAETIGSL